MLWNKPKSSRLFFRLQRSSGHQYPFHVGIPKLQVQRPPAPGSCSHPPSQMSPVASIPSDVTYLPLWPFQFSVKGTNTRTKTVWGQISALPPTSCAFPFYRSRHQAFNYCKMERMTVISLSLWGCSKGLSELKPHSGTCKDLGAEPDMLWGPSVHDYSLSTSWGRYNMIAKDRDFGVRQTWSEVLAASELRDSGHT